MRFAVRPASRGLRLLVAVGFALAVSVAAAESLDDLRKLSLGLLGPEYPLYTYEVVDVDTLERNLDEDCTFLVMIPSGEAAHLDDLNFLESYYFYRYHGGPPPRLIDRLTWNDPGMTPAAATPLARMRDKFAERIFPVLLTAELGAAMFVTSSLRQALVTALSVVPSWMVRSLQTEWIATDDLRAPNSGFGISWRRSKKTATMSCDRKLLAKSPALAMEALTWRSSESLEDAHGEEAIDFSNLPNHDPLRIWPRFDNGLFSEERTRAAIVNGELLSFESTKDAMNRVGAALHGILSKKTPFVIMSAHLRTIEFALSLGKNSRSKPVPEPSSPCQMYILKITNLRDVYTAPAVEKETGSPTCRSPFSRLGLGSIMRRLGRPKSQRGRA